MVYEYLCTNDTCGVTTELTLRMSDPRPESIDCPYCEGRADFKFSAPALMTGGMSKKSFDAVVGADAERRWASIHARQEKRNKMRQETGSVGIHATAYDKFEPISEQTKRIRTNVSNAVMRQGFRSET